MCDVKIRPKPLEKRYNMGFLYWFGCATAEDYQKNKFDDRENHKSFLEENYE